MIRSHVLFRGDNNQIPFDLCQLAGLMPLLWIRQLGFESLSPSHTFAIRVQYYAVVKVHSVAAPIILAGGGAAARLLLLQPGPVQRNPALLCELLQLLTVDPIPRIFCNAIAWQLAGGDPLADRFIGYPEEPGDL